MSQLKDIYISQTSKYTIYHYMCICIFPCPNVHIYVFLNAIRNLKKLIFHSNTPVYVLPFSRKNDIINIFMKPVVIIYYTHMCITF